MLTFFNPKSLKCKECGHIIGKQKNGTENLDIDFEGTEMDDDTMLKKIKISKDGEIIFKLECILVCPECGWKHFEIL